MIRIRQVAFDPPKPPPNTPHVEHSEPVPPKLLHDAIEKAKQEKPQTYTQDSLKTT